MATSTRVGKGGTGGVVNEKLAGTTRLELATSAVTGQRSNQLNYVPSFALERIRGNPLY